MKRQLFSLVVLLIGLQTHAFASDPYNGFGGYAGIELQPSGYFYVTQHDGRWWLVDPVGNGFISKSVSGVDFRLENPDDGTRSRYADLVRERFDHDEEAWALDTLSRLKQWGFNTIGTGASPSITRQMIPFMQSLDISERGAVSIGRQRIVDVFSRRFRSMARHVSMTRGRPLTHDATLVGYLSDTDTDWMHTDLFVTYASLGPDRDGYQKAVAFLEHRYRNLENLNEAWGTTLGSFSDVNESTVEEANPQYVRDRKAFRLEMLRRYFSLSRESIRDDDPNHLFWGCPVPAYDDNEAIALVGEFCDVLLIQMQWDAIDRARLEQIHVLTSRPIVVALTQFRQPSSSKAPLPACEERLRVSVETLMELPFIVGYDWAMFAEPQYVPAIECRGLVQMNNEPRSAFVQAWQTINQSAEKFRLPNTGNDNRSQ